MNQPSVGLIPSVSIEALIAARDGALRAYEQSAELLKAARARLVEFEAEMPRVAVQLPGGVYSDLLDGKNAETLRREVDRSVWRALFKKTHLETVMSAEARRKLGETLWGTSHSSYGREGDLPPLTVENVRATFEGVHASVGKYFEDGIEAIYRRLSWDHKTNRPGLIGDYLIVSGFVSVWRGSAFLSQGMASLQYHETLLELERVLLVLDGQPAPIAGQGIRGVQRLPFGTWQEISGPVRPVLAVKVFKKGTAHVRILNPAHVQTLNRTMARRYPGAVMPPDPHKGRARKSARGA